MEEKQNSTKTEIVEMADLQTDFLSLRIGEKIPLLEIKQIRKVTNPSREDNLPGVDYKYFIETSDGKVLTANSWVLWNAIAKALKEAGKIQTTLYLEHMAREKYLIRLA